MVGEAYGQAEAEMLRDLLQAHDIPVWLSGESAGSAIGLSGGPMGRIEIWVRKADFEQAREYLQQEQGRPN